MNKRIIELAEEAGFCFWGDEDWKPHGAIIDWSADYDREFQKYTELLIKECAEIAKETRWAIPPSQEMIARSIEEHFR